MSIKHWVNEGKVGFGIGYCPKLWSKYHLDTLPTTFSEKNNYLGTAMVKILFVDVWKCIILGVFHRSDFWHLLGKSALIFSKWLFFQKILRISWFTKSGKIQVKRYTLPKLFINKMFGDTFAWFVSYLSLSTLLCKNFVNSFLYKCSLSEFTRQIGK